MNPRTLLISKSKFQSHLNKLIEENLVEVVILPENKRKRDPPYRFYGITEETRRLVTKYKLVRSETSLQILYKQRDKPDEIIRYQNAPRPEG